MSSVWALPLPIFDQIEAVRSAERCLQSLVLLAVVSAIKRRLANPICPCGWPRWRDLYPAALSCSAVRLAEVSIAIVVQPPRVQRLVLQQRRKTKNWT